MNAPTLPIPNPTEWMTIDAAAEKLGCSRRTVTRYLESGALKLYRPQHGQAERPPTMLWADEVRVLAMARRVVKGGDRG